MWGKIIGGMAGFAMGGPFGAVMGAAFGHAAETGMAGKMPGQFSRFSGFSINFGQPRMISAGQREQFFAQAVVVLSAKVARCDGPITRVEIDAFKKAFRIPPEAVRDIGILFDQARESADDPLVYANGLGEAFADNPNVLEDVLVALFSISTSDGPLNHTERDLLAGICRGFRLGRAEWDRASGAAPRRMTHPGEEDPYAVMGVSRSATPQEMRDTWKALMRQYHPDTMASKGLAPDLAAKASDKVARINAAWDRIKRERGI